MKVQKLNQRNQKTTTEKKAMKKQKKNSKKQKQKLFGEDENTEELTFNLELGSIKSDIYYCTNNNEMQYKAYPIWTELTTLWKVDFLFLFFNLVK